VNLFSAWSVRLVFFLSPLFWAAIDKHLKNQYRAVSLLFPKLPSPSSPSLSSQQRSSSPRVIAGASSGPDPTAPALSCAEGSRAGLQDSRGAQQSGAEGQNPLPHPVPTLLGMQLRARLACWAASAHCRVTLSFSLPASPSPFSD